MNGPEHYTEAERLLDLLDPMLSEVAKGPTNEANYGLQTIALTVAAAGAHATLALAAASALSAVEGPEFPGTNAAREWRGTIL